MVRKPAHATSDSETPDASSNREKIVSAFLALLAERPFEEIGWGDIASRAGIPLRACRAEFGSTLGVIAAHMKALDEQVLAEDVGDMLEEPPRERLFDVLMRRIELLKPHRAATRSLLRSVRRNPGLAFALNGLAVRSQQWMLTAAGIDSSGPKGMIRAQGLALMFADVLRTFVDDEDEGLARTMAALDRALARGQRWSGLLDDLCRFVPPRCPDLRRRRRPHRETGEEPAAA